jgi:hypothetical protein
MRPLVWTLPLTVILTVATWAHAGDGPAVDETTALFASAARALHEGRAGDAISSLETLADLGVVDPVASYNRGLAYALRVRIGAEVPGDLGRAAHGFEEARERSRDPRLIEDALRAVGVVRSEIARRRARAAQPVEVDPGRSLARTVSGLLAEDTWSAIAAASSAVLAIGLLVRWLARARRMRITGGVAAGIAALLLLVATAMTIAARNDRTRVREAVVVVANARPVDERGITVQGAAPLPEGARVEVIGARGPWGRVRFGTIEAWVASDALRDLARAE